MAHGKYGNLVGFYRTEFTHSRIAIYRLLTRSCGWVWARGALHGAFGWAAWRGMLATLPTDLGYDSPWPPYQQQHETPNFLQCQPGVGREGLTAAMGGVSAAMGARES